MENLDANVTLKGKDTLNMYIEKYFDKLYTKEDFDEEYQDWFLNFVNNKLSDNEIRILESRVTNNEILRAIKDMNINKAPGLDGIPIEFYLHYWDIIKNEFVIVVRNIINGMLLNDQQRKAIITLIPKDGGDLESLKSWRPVSLICCDVKVVAKILAKRLKPLMYSLISENQYCVEGRSINDCNNRIRDILYYSGTNNKTGAVINIDWEKAFDRVNWEFLMKVLRKMRFPNFIITWIMTLYTNIQSQVLVNGYFTKAFDIGRGVRQGCPLSMIIFIMFQNPMYIALERTISRPIEINGKKVIESGYADDTNIFTDNDQSFLEAFKVLNYFEKATNSRLNVKKTVVYGFGEWKNRTNWPIKELKIEIEYFSTLGIIFSENYDVAIEVMWNKIYNKIKNRIPLISNRFFTLYQKAVLINSLLASKLWYVSHVYPLPMKFAVLINKEIFHFLWGSYANPLKRDVLYNKKVNGGIGLLNIYQKSKSILVSTVMKSFLNSERDELVRYYMANKIGIIFNILNLPRTQSHGNTPYFEFTVDAIKKCSSHKNFPNLRSKDIYETIMPMCKPNVELLYPNYDWKNIWIHLNFRYINVHDRNVIYKYIYEILPTNKRRYQIQQKDSPLCERCQVEESNIHKFYYCSKVQNCIVLLRKIIFYICGLQVDSLLQILMFEFPKVDKRNVNSLCVIISSYIACVWYNRENNDNLIYAFKARLLRNQRLNIKILDKKALKIFSENYCKMDIRIIDRM